MFSNKLKKTSNLPRTHRDRSFQLIGIKKISNLLQETPENIVLKICDAHFGFDNYLSANHMGTELIKELVKVILKSYECNSLKQKLFAFTSSLVSSKLYQDILYDSMNLIEVSYNIELIASVLRITCNIIEAAPLLTDKVGKIRDRLELLILHRISNPELSKEFTERLIPMEEKALLKIKSIQNASSNTFRNIGQTDLDPPNDFTEMSIVPTFADIITDQKSFLRKNITNGAYRNVHHYLDVQFRLLREDYLSPLREGISKFRSIVQESFPGTKNFNQIDKFNITIKRQLSHIESLSVIFDVTLKEKVYGLNGMSFNMKMKQEKGKPVSWEQSKKLMFGSLVILSSDFFMNECLIGVISERDDKNLKNGIIQVRFEHDTTNLNKINTPEFQKVYTMVETTAYFESYKHVLEALVSFKNYKDEEFPFKKNLVDCQNCIIEQPVYLKNVPFDFRTIVDKKREFSINNKSGETERQFAGNTEFARCFLSNEFQWPTAENMMLDESQYKAVKLALTSKLSLIQGPPGTGKTFIGVKIMELLMQNKELWWNRPGQPKRPILMICYTNHALDQFLNYCIDECHLSSGIIRVGGRSTSERLKPFLLSEVKRQMKDSREINQTLHFQLKKQFFEFKNIEKEINFPMTVLNRISNSSVISMQVLEDIVEPEIFRQFFRSQVTGLFSDSDYYLLEWLGLFDINKFGEVERKNLENSFEKTNINHDDEVDTESANDDQDDDELTKAANNERMLDNDYVERLETNELVPQLMKAFRKTTYLDFKCLKEMCIEYNTAIESPYLRNMTEEWNIAGSKRNCKKSSPIDQFLSRKLDKLLNSIDIDQYEKLNKINIYDLNKDQRGTCYRYWLNEYKKIKEQEVLNLQSEFNNSANLLRELRLQEDRFIMKDAHIIAMTTTGSSRYHNILKDIGPRIVIVEEAAEVFEAHIVSALSKNCEHLILIGDHIQLRPSPSVYKLATTFKLDVSLFERLINNNITSVMLNTQHRMRPEISCLMKHFYNQPINDHLSVNSFPKIIGVKTDIFFLSHNKMESRVADGSSKENKFEANFIVEFCVYLAKQGYEQSDITVLSMYLAQMRIIRKELKERKLSLIKVSTVDNYQGEENKIVILSLVRSNKDDKIGFLGIDNRVCVAFSRAQYGFYCIGNMNLMSRNSEKWESLLSEMKLKNKVGTALGLSCGIHPENDIIVTEPEDFKLRPDGGCLKPCDFRLDCGHVCALKCHTYDLKHEYYECSKNCNKTISRCGHPCKQKCSHEFFCDICSVKMDKVIQECGHTVKIDCDKIPNKKDCHELCERILSCGHRCTKLCGMNCGDCDTKVEVISNCEHKKEKLKVSCKNVGQVWKYQENCDRICNQVLECEHLCKKSCSKCFGGYIHAKCQEKCDRILYCGHRCTQPCAKQCKPCIEKCQNRCPHSKCQQKCSEPCKPCNEKCMYSCCHMTCSKLCYEICDRKPCNESCKKKIKKCGHPCIGLCGEPCPSLCRICDGKNETFSIFFGSEDELDAKFVLLEDCGHIFESSGMDQWMESKTIKNESTVIKLPECPRCRTPIRFTLRYLNHVKVQLHAIETIKCKQYGDKAINEKNRINLLTAIEDHMINLGAKLDRSAIFTTLFNQNVISVLKKQKCFSANDLTAYQNIWEIYSNLQDLEIIMKEKIQEKELQNPNALAHLMYEFKKIEQLITSENHANQRLNELLFESERCKFLLNFYLMESNVDKQSQKNNQDAGIISDLIKKLKEILIFEVKPFTPIIEQQVKDLFQNLKQLMKFEMTKQEKQMILKAMGLNQGHWFKCPNDHIYCITECGGAMQKSTCPDCNEEIGGTDHSLLSSNKLASEMDGAQFASWSDTANNIRNWEI